MSAPFLFSFIVLRFFSLLVSQIKLYKPSSVSLYSSIIFIKERTMDKDPKWLECLLRTEFFYICPIHCESPKNECNMFCLACLDEGFCVICRSSYHKEHPVMQIRRSSYHNVVKVVEMEKALDISEVQTYVINNGRVVFLNKRPAHPKNSSKAGVSSNPNSCEICSRTLNDPKRFCSLGCLVEGVKKNKEEEEEEAEEEEGLREEREEETHKGTLRPNSRRRKGIPCRSAD